MFIIDTGTLPETHEIRQRARKHNAWKGGTKVSEPTLWVISKASDHWDCEYLIEFGFTKDPKTGKFGQWICSWFGSNSLEEVISEARQHGLKGVRGIV